MIFLDSSAIIAYKNADDINHKKATDIFQKLNAGDYGVGVIIGIRILGGYNGTGAAKKHGCCKGSRECPA